MGHFDQYGLPELCHIVETDRPEDMRHQADGWGVLAGVFEEQLTRISDLRTRLRGSWDSSATDSQLSTMDELAVVLTDAIEIAESNRTAWYGIAHYAEYAKEQLTVLREHWAAAREAAQPPADDRYVPGDISVQVGEPTEEAELRISYDEAAREVMEVVAEYTTELAVGLRSLPVYVPPLSDDGGRLHPAPVSGSDPAFGSLDPAAGSAASQGDPELQQVGTPGMPMHPGGGMGSMGMGMGGMGPGSGSSPMLAGPAGMTRPTGGAPTVSATVSSGGYTSSVVGGSATPSPGRRRAPRIQRAPRVAPVTQGTNVVGKSRRPVVVPVEYDVARLRRRTRSEDLDEDHPWSPSQESMPGIISGTER